MPVLNQTYGASRLKTMVILKSETNWLSKNHSTHPLMWMNMLMGTCIHIFQVHRNYKPVNIC